jgi:hypothetical protein
VAHAAIVGVDVRSFSPARPSRAAVVVVVCANATPAAAARNARLSMSHYAARIQPMKKLLLALLATAPLFAQGAPPQGGSDQPYTLEYYYKVQWGKQQEFLKLFLKNHYPMLLKNVERGRMLSVKIETPANHMTEESRWDYRVTIRFKNSTLATTSNPDEARLIQQLWPDQATYEKEEQRRFEILLAHWDLPVTDITPKK